ncbi:MAG: hypothetical protein U0414_20335 [Polyangiaceae bacterium]
MMTREELGSCADALRGGDVGGIVAGGVPARLAATLTSPDEVARGWAAILWGALFDRGAGATIGDSADLEASEALVEVARGEGAHLAELDALVGAHPVYDEAPGARLEALASIAALGARAGASVGALVEILEASGETEGARVLAAEALGAIAARGGATRVEDPRIVAALTRALTAENDGEGAIREAALGALREIGSPARSAIPALKAALGDRANVFLFESISETLATLDAS